MITELIVCMMYRVNGWIFFEFEYLEYILISSDVILQAVERDCDIWQML